MNIQVAKFAIIPHIHRHHGTTWFHMYTRCQEVITKQRPKGPRGLWTFAKGRHFSANPYQPKNVLMGGTL